MKKIGPLLIILAGTFWGTMGIFVRILNGYGIMAMQIVEIRAAIATVILGIVILLYNRKLFKINIRDIWCFIGTGIIGLILFNICYFTTIQVSSLSIAAILLYTAPIFVIILSAFLFKERITATKIVSLIMALSGCILVSGIMLDSSGLDFKGFAIGLGSGLGYALYTIFNRAAINRGYSPLTIQFYTFLCAAIGGVLFTDFNQIVTGITVEPMKVISIMIATALITTAIPNVIYTFGLKHVENGKASVMASVEPVMATIFGIILFDEIPSLMGFIGIIMVFASLAIVNMPSKKAKTEIAEKG